VATNHVLGLDRGSQAAWDVATAAAELSAALGAGTRQLATESPAASVKASSSN
jgi:hypothetical protein